MAVDTFIPEVWNANLLTTLAKRYVFAQSQVSNRNYEGDIAQYGDTVHIGSLTDPTVASYVKNVTAINPATLVTTDQTLVIDQSKYFAFEVDDVDARQVRDSGNLMASAMNRAGAQLADVADQFLAGLMTTGAGTILTPAAINSVDAAFLLLRNLRLKLDKANVPTEGRFVVVSPEFYALVLGDNRFIDASRYGSSVPIRNGEVGQAIGFAILVSNNLPAGTAATAPAVSNFIVAGHPMALTYAEQISKTEAFRPPDSFSDAVKGLHLYGAKVVRPEALVVQDTDVTVA
jgi:N4-gp56 family major capsid protein